MRVSEKVIERSEPVQETSSLREKTIESQALKSGEYKATITSIEVTPYFTVHQTSSSSAPLALNFLELENIKENAPLHVTNVTPRMYTVYPRYHVNFQVNLPHGDDFYFYADTENKFPLLKKIRESVGSLEIFLDQDVDIIYSKSENGNTLLKFNGANEKSEIEVRKSKNRATPYISKYSNQDPNFSFSNEKSDIRRVEQWLKIQKALENEQKEWITREITDVRENLDGDEIVLVIEGLPNPAVFTFDYSENDSSRYMRLVNELGHGDTNNIQGETIALRLAREGWYEDTSTRRWKSHENGLATCVQNQWELAIPSDVTLHQNNPPQSKNHTNNYEKIFSIFNSLTG